MSVKCLCHWGLTEYDTGDSMAMKRSRKTTPAGHRLVMNDHRQLAFSPEEYQRRYDLVLENMRRVGTDVLLVRGPENITYLTGYETPGYYGYHCLVLARDEQPVLVGRRIELTNVPVSSWITRTVNVQDHEVPAEITARVLDKMGLSRAGSVSRSAAGSSPSMSTKHSSRRCPERVSSTARRWSRRRG